MSQYAHFPVKGDTFWKRYRNACFQWIKWWDFPVMTCAECGVRIIPSIPAMILNDVCYMIGLFFLPYKDVYKRECRVHSQLVLLHNLGVI